MQGTAHLPACDRRQLLARAWAPASPVPPPAQHARTYKAPANQTPLFTQPLRTDLILPCTPPSLPSTFAPLTCPPAEAPAGMPEAPVGTHTQRAPPASPPRLPPPPAPQAPLQAAVRAAAAACGAAALAQVVLGPCPQRVVQPRVDGRGERLHGGGGGGDGGLALAVGSVRNVRACHAHLFVRVCWTARLCACSCVLALTWCVPATTCACVAVRA